MDCTDSTPLRADSWSKPALLSRNVVSHICDLKFSSSLAFKKFHLEITIESQEVAKPYIFPCIFLPFTNFPMIVSCMMVGYRSTTRKLPLAQSPMHLFYMHACGVCVCVCSSLQFHPPWRLMCPPPVKTQMDSLAQGSPLLPSMVTATHLPKLMDLKAYSQP